MGFKLDYYNVAVKHINDYATRLPPLQLDEAVCVYFALKAWTYLFFSQL